MMRLDARGEVLKALKEKGLSRGEAVNKMRLGKCSRTGDIIEPMLKPQWWLDCSGMAKRATDAVRNGELKIIPEDHKKTWYVHMLPTAYSRLTQAVGMCMHVVALSLRPPSRLPSPPLPPSPPLLLLRCCRFRWLDNIRDWCISRQLWWGHRIPAYYITVNGIQKEVPIVAASMEEATQKACDEYDCTVKDLSIVQDEDVMPRHARTASKQASMHAANTPLTLPPSPPSPPLPVQVLDTWFSSGLFPFSPLGWPDETHADLMAWHPTSLLETGQDILFFWVARMVMCSLQVHAPPSRLLTQHTPAHAPLCHPPSLLSHIHSSHCVLTTSS